MIPDAKLLGWMLKYLSASVNLNEPLSGLCRSSPGLWIYCKFWILAAAWLALLRLSHHRCRQKLCKQTDNLQEIHSPVHHKPPNSFSSRAQICRTLRSHFTPTLASALQDERGGKKEKMKGGNRGRERIDAVTGNDIFEKRYCKIMKFQGSISTLAKWTLIKSTRQEIETLL